MFKGVDVGKERNNGFAGSVKISNTVNGKKHLGTVDIDIVQTEV
jgi:hypothetical protein